MTVEVFAEWLRRQGLRVATSPSSAWFEAAPGAWQAFPFHRLLSPEEGELAAFLRERRGVALRCSAPLQAPRGCVSYHVVCEDPGYRLEALDRRTRQNVKAGLAHCLVEQVPIERLAAEGYALELDSCARQGRPPALDEAGWRRRYLAAAALPGFEAWAALVDGALAATLLAVRLDDCVELLSQQTLARHAAARVNHALTFVATQALITRPGVRSVFYTLQSLDAPPSVDEFKFRMGYVPRPVRQRVAFHPWLAPAVRALGPAVLPLLSSRAAGTRLAKAAGLLRLHAQGREPLAAQRWPECLAGQREALLREAAPGRPPEGPPPPVPPAAPPSAPPSAAAPSGTHGSYPAVKRSVDVALSAAGLVVALPLLAALAGAVKLSSPGPVLFRQVRMGRGGRPFTLLKFRTMADGAAGPPITAGGDPRVTAVGRALRASKLDELPQLWNVLTGDMSLVGPRPELQRYVERFPDAYARLLAVRPGLTDFAALAYRHEEEVLAAAPEPERAYVEEVLPEKLRLSQRYLEEMSPWTDLSLLVKTAAALLR